MAQPWITTVEEAGVKREAVKIGDVISANDGDVSISMVTYELLSKNMDIPVCVDIGVDKGWWSQFCIAVHPGAIVHAYEPNPISYRALATKFAQEPNITLYNRAVSDSSGSMPLHLDEGQSHSRDLSGGVLVEKVTLDNLFEKVERVFLMKIDTEGHEPQVFRGLDQYFDRIDNIIFEFTTHWYGNTKTAMKINSGKLLTNISESYPYLYILSRRGPVKAFGPIEKGTIYDHVIFLNEIHLQVDILASRRPLETLELERIY